MTDNTVAEPAATERRLDELRGRRAARDAERAASTNDAGTA
jgi:hypothetical protein